MNIAAIKNKIADSSYDFLSDRPELGDNIVLLGLGGSHAYGTDVEDSDLDIRGIAVNTRKNIILGRQFEQSVDYDTDTTIFSLDKIINLFCSCNPNTIEMLGLKPEHYLFCHEIGLKILANKSIFLSKRAINSFGGYANQQLRRLENKSSRTATQEREEEFILRSIQNAQIDFQRRYFDVSDGGIKLYIDKGVHEGFNTEIFLDATIKHYPLRDFKDMLSDMGSIIRSYNTIGRRNENAMSHNKIAKHMMHLVRLYLMCFDLLLDGKINTYREKDHDLLMSIRSGSFLDENDQPTKAFYELVDDLESKLEYCKSHSVLPDNPDMEKVERLQYEINSEICDKDNVKGFMDWRKRLLQ